MMNRIHAPLLQLLWWKKFPYFSEIVLLDILSLPILNFLLIIINGLIDDLFIFLTGLGKGRKFNQTKGGSRRAATKSRDSLKLRRKR